MAADLQPEATLIRLHEARPSRRRRVAPLRRVTVVIAGGHTLMRAGIRLLLERHDRIQVVGETACGRTAAMLARRERPDVVLLDPGQPEDRGSAPLSVEALAATGAAVLLLAEPAGDGLDAALRAGARGILPRGAGPADLAHAVRSVARGDAVLSRAAANRLLSIVVSREPDPSEVRPWNSGT
jgi:DNA-binding NarL/FixJ family response regulator